MNVRATRWTKQKWCYKYASLDLDAPPDHPPTLYDLLSNVTHESVAGTTRDKANTVWKIHLRAGGGGGDGERWFEVQDLIVQEVRKEMIFLGESVLQVRRGLSHPFLPSSHVNSLSGMAASRRICTNHSPKQQNGHWPIGLWHEFKTCHCALYCPPRSPDIFSSFVEYPSIGFRISGMF